jgi:hypothetical protein
MPITLSENLSIEPKFYKGTPVVTFKDIDAIHQRPEGTASRNFRENTKHFVLEEDYFRRNSSEAKNEYKTVAPNGLILLTESGYLLLVKSFTDELSWKIQKILVKNYFRAKETGLNHNDLPLTFRGVPCIMANSLPKKYDRSRSLINQMINTKLTPKKDYLKIHGSAMSAFQNENPGVNKAVTISLIVFPSGIEKLDARYNHYNHQLTLFDAEKKNSIEKLAKMLAETDKEILAGLVLKYGASHFKFMKTLKEIEKLVGEAL